jgi:hypothetical protein
LFLLSASAALHDLGKIKAEGTGKSSDHGEIAAKWLFDEGNWQKCHIENKVHAKAIAAIIRAHSKGDFNKLPEVFVILSPPGIFLRSLASIFRLADMLDTDFRRCPDLVKSLRQLLLPREVSTWMARSTIGGWDKSSDGKTLLLIASPENQEERIAALACVDFLNHDLTKSQKHTLENFSVRYWTGTRYQTGTLRFPSRFSLAELEGSTLKEKGGLAQLYNEFTNEYRNRLTSSFSDVRLRGIGDFSENRSVKLSQVFVDIKVTLASGWAPKSYRKFDDHLVSLIQDSLECHKIPISDIFKMRKLRKIILLGEPGSGKSTISQFLLSNFSSTPENAFMPILLSIRDFASSRKDSKNILIKYIASQISNVMGKSVPYGFVEFWLSKPETLVIFDGLDEVGSPNEREQIRDLIVKFVADFPEPTYFMTSRIVGYNEGPFEANEFLHLLLLGLEKDDIESFVRRWYCAREVNPDDREAAIRGFLESLKDEHVFELAQNPLLLTIMALVHRGEADLPRQRALLYDKCVEAFMVSRNRAKDLLLYDENEIRACHEFLGYWMHTKAEQVKGSFSGINQAELKEALLNDMNRRHPEIGSMNKEKVEEFIEAARKRVGLIVERGNFLWAFGHRSFQEYFAARYISQNTCGIDEIWREIGNKIGKSHWVEPLKLLAGIYGFSSRKTLQELVAKIMHEHQTEDDKNRKLIMAGEIAGEVQLTFPLLQDIATETTALLLETRDSNLFNDCKRILDHFYTTTDLWQHVVKCIRERTESFAINSSKYSCTAFHAFYFSRKISDTKIDRVIFGFS